MNVVVTGGTGFLGRHMVAALLERECNVIILARSPEKVAIAEHPNLSIWQGDITEPDSLIGLTENVDVVYHFAAQIGEWNLPDDLFYSVKTNCS